MNDLLEAFVLTEAIPDAGMELANPHHGCRRKQVFSIIVDLAVVAVIDLKEEVLLQNPQFVYFTFYYLTLSSRIRNTFS